MSKADQPTAGPPGETFSSDRRKQIIVITGMSGSGKHTAFKAFEDLGFLCVDNLPTRLVPRLVEMTLASGGKIDRLAVVVDVRSGDTQQDFERLVGRLRRFPFQSQVLFFDAADTVLARRYSETRRLHPLARDGSLTDGFRRERTAMAGIRGLADWVIDTSEMSVHDLRRLIYDRFRDARPGVLRVSVVSFGYKYGLPYNADLVFDVRFLPNPYFTPQLREKTGEDPGVVHFLMEAEETRETVDRLTDLLEFLLPRYQHEGKSYCTIAVGCTGGRHRSVVVAGELRRRLAERGYDVTLTHRDLGRDE